jgi:hypothetical protein
MRRITIVVSVCVATAAALVTACDSGAGTASGAPTSSGRDTPNQSTSDNAEPSTVDCAPAQGYGSGGHQPDRKLGESTLAVGVREKLPFRVFTQLDETDQVRKLVVDVAHQP